MGLRKYIKHFGVADSGMMSLLNSLAVYFFFDRQKQNYIRKWHLEENPKAYKEYTKGTLRHKQKKSWQFIEPSS